MQMSVNQMFISLCGCWLSEPLRFVAFRCAKGHVLQAERPCFILQKGVFCCADD